MQICQNIKKLILSILKLISEILLNFVFNKDSPEAIILKWIQITLIFLLDILIIFDSCFPCCERKQKKDPGNQSLNPMDEGETKNDILEKRKDRLNQFLNALEIEIDYLQEFTLENGEEDDKGEIRKLLAQIRTKLSQKDALNKKILNIR